MKNTNEKNKQTLRRLANSHGRPSVEVCGRKNLTKTEELTKNELKGEHKYQDYRQFQTQAATGKAQELFEAVQAKLKITANITRVMANSPAVLEAYLSFSGALAGGALPAKLREEIALEVGEQNSCQYCVSAHTAIGKMTGLSESGISGGQAASKYRDELEECTCLSILPSPAKNEDFYARLSRG